MIRRLLGYGGVALGILAVIACDPAGAQTRAPDAKPIAQPIIPPLTPPEGVAALIPLGEAAGAYALNLPDDVPNPLEGRPGAVAEGHRRFIEMNCAGCHGYDAAGAMGPNLTDKYWRYGGTPVQVFKSIYEGRPGGMPAWSGALPAQEIWKIVAFIESLGGTYPPGFYHQASQGDQEGELTAPEVVPKIPTTAIAPSQGPNQPMEEGQK